MSSKNRKKEITVKRIMGIAGLLLAIGFGVFVYGGWQMFGDEIRAIRTLKMVKDRICLLPYILNVCGMLPLLCYRQAVISHIPPNCVHT